MPRSWVTLPALLLSVTSACSSGSVARDAVATRGSEPGVASAEPSAQSIAPTVTAASPEVPGAATVVSAEDDCRASTYCSVEGRCGLIDGRCEAISAADCRASEACSLLARCSLVEGACAAAEDADCSGSNLCTEFGACFVQAGSCVAKDDAGCRSSLQSCASLGRCAVEAGQCIATTDEDCSVALTCESYGACAALQGACVPTSDADCRRSSLQCATYGRCGSVENQCAAISDADCRASSVCATDAACVAQDGVCVVASSEDCGSSQACDLFERCVAGQGLCVVPRPDCTEGRACPAGTCVDFGECSAPTPLDCVRSIQCAQQGLCSAGDSGCEATAASCVGSERCESHGRCLAWRGTCHTRGETDAECRAGNDCLEFGWCSSFAGACVAAADADCQPSAACLASGLCIASDGECIAPSRHRGSGVPLASPTEDDTPSSAPAPSGAPVAGSPDAWSEPRVTDPAWRLAVPEGRLAFPPHDMWQDQRVRLPAFQLDATEVTIARLRSYVEWAQGRPPAVGLGAARAIEGSGWNAAWDEKVSLDVVTEQLRLSLTDRCEVDGELGEAVAYEDESVRPANCISWYAAFALCISEGGRLPTVVEWTYAAEGGSQGRLYPWGDDPPTQEYVALDCLGDGIRGCSAADLLDVGSRPLGAGRWGHLDLAGSLEEWALDALTNGGLSHWIRSSGFELEASFMPVRAEQYGRGDDSTDWYLGARCAGE